MRRIGLISDTHDLLRPEAKAVLAGCEHIIHAGDITVAQVIDELASLAPVTAVRGNNDRDAWALDLAEVEILHFDQVSLYVIHDLAQLDQLPPSAPVRVVISGHSHKPSIRETDGVLHVNPGSAGRRRFTLPVTVGELLIDGDQVSARIIELAVAPPKRKKS